jgi:hypothetical protein
MLLMRAAPLRSKTGELQGAVAAATDATERLRYEDHLKLLLNELDHRVKNTLAIVQSIATLTLKDVDPQARAAFEERLPNLSAVHNLLTDESWNSTSLASVARTSLRAARERVSFDGDGLRPKSAVALSMALHELGTNALKYGALSIERGLAAGLQGEVRIDWPPQGVVRTIDAPIEAIHDRGSAAFDIALLDINFNGRQSFPVADAVRARGLRLLFATGYGSRIVPEPYRDAPILQKPFSLEELRAALAKTGVA